METFHCVCVGGGGSGGLAFCKLNGIANTNHEITIRVIFYDCKVVSVEITKSRYYLLDNQTFKLFELGKSVVNHGCNHFYSYLLFKNGGKIKICILILGWPKSLFSPLPWIIYIYVPGNSQRSLYFWYINSHTDSRIHKVWIIDK